jgi:hypothetical protein
MEGRPFSLRSSKDEASFGPLACLCRPRTLTRPTWPGGQAGNIQQLNQQGRTLAGPTAPLPKEREIGLRIIPPLQDAETTG